MAITSWRIIPYLTVFMVKPCRQDQRLILLSYFQNMSFILLSLFDVWPLISYFGFLKVSWFAKEL